MDCGLLWCFYQTLILTAPIHYRASIAETLMQCYISPNLMKTQTPLHLLDLRVSAFLAKFHSRANYSFKGHRRILKCVQESIISSWTIKPEPWLQFSSNVCSTLQLYYRHTDTFLRLFLTMCHINACANVHSEVNMLRLWLWWCLWIF